MSKIAPIMVEEMQGPWKHGCNFHPYSTSNIPNISNPNINLSLKPQTKCDDIISDPESDHIFSHLFSYVVIIHLLQSGGGVGIYCPLIPRWIESTWAKMLSSCQIQNGDTEPNSKYYLEEYWRGPAQDFPYDLILWYASKIIYLS